MPTVEITMNEDEIRDAIIEYFWHRWNIQFADIQFSSKSLTIKGTTKLPTLECRAGDK